MTDGVTSHVFYLYEHGGMNWRTNYGGRLASVGFQLGRGVFANNPYSLRQEVFDIDKIPGNVSYLYDRSPDDDDDDDDYDIYNYGDNGMRIK